MLELGLVLALVMVLRVGLEIRHKVNAKCRVWSATRKNRSGRARAWCRAGIECTAKAKVNGKVIPARELKTTFRGIPYNLCHLRLAPAQGFDPNKKCDLRLLRRQHMGKKRAKGQGPRAKGQGTGKEAKRQRGKEAERQRFACHCVDNNFHYLNVFFVDGFQLYEQHNLQ